MHNRIKIKRRGKQKYYAAEIPLQYRQPDEPRREIMATSREELTRKYEQEIERRKQGLDRNAGKRPLSVFLEHEFLPFYRNEVEPQTWCDYRFHIQTHIGPSLGAIQLDGLTTRQIDQWMLSIRSKESERTGKPLSDRTIDYAFSVLRRALQFAVDWRYIAFNPASARVRVARRRKKTKVVTLRFLTPEQAKTLLGAVREHRYEALYTLALTTGMREGELLGLKWADLNLDESRLTVNHSLAHTKRKKGESGERFFLKGPKTVGSRRTIDIPQVTVTALRQHVKRQAEMKRAAADEWSEQNFVFTSRRGTPLDRSNALHQFQEILKDHNLPKIRFYDLRHTHASLLIAEGVHPKKIAERLGHASIKLTMDTYGHLFEGSDHESAERMDRLFGASAPGRAPHIEEGGKILVFRTPAKKLHADKNADTTAQLEIAATTSD